MFFFSFFDLSSYTYFSSMYSSVTVMRTWSSSLPSSFLFACAAVIIFIPVVVVSLATHQMQTRAQSQYYFTLRPSLTTLWPRIRIEDRRSGVS